MRHWTRNFHFRFDARQRTESGTFEADELGFALVKGSGLVPAALKEKALLAVRNCPEYAIRAERE
jgi:hypothetical protein